ncbi:MAG: FkbM family methyltransferase [Ilumatobacteraceae bacterium]
MLSTLASALLHLLTFLPGFERELRVLTAVVRRGDTVVDLGAALGVYSFSLAAIVGRDGAVHAFEPRPSASRRLTRLARWLRLPWLHVHGVAAGATAGHDVVVVPGRRWGIPGRSYLGGRARHHRHDDGLVTVDQHQTWRVTLDSHFLLDGPPAQPGAPTRQRVNGRHPGHLIDRPPIAFIKCDIEGGELDALRGAERILTTDRPIVMCEIEERHVRRFGHEVREVVAFLTGCRYERIDLGARGSADGRNQLWAPIERATTVRSALSS